MTDCDCVGQGGKTVKALTASEMTFYFILLRKKSATHSPNKLTHIIMSRAGSFVACRSKLAVEKSCSVLT